MYVHLNICFIPYFYTYAHYNHQWTHIISMYSILCTYIQYIHTYIANQYQQGNPNSKVRFSVYVLILMKLDAHLYFLLHAVENSEKVESEQYIV